MANGINKFIGIGNLTRDPETRYATSGQAITSFDIAINENWKDKEGQRQEKTEYIKVVTFGKLAEICGEYLHCGKQVYVEGKLQTRKWEDKDGNNRWTTEIVVNQMQMLGNKSDVPTNTSSEIDPPTDDAPDMEDIPY